LQACTVAEANERSIALQGNAVAQAWGNAPQNPCSTMSFEFPAQPPTFSRLREKERTAHDKIKVIVRDHKE
jgi:hypothetical protein